MLITKLTLNNFRVFRGFHEIDLTPSAPIRDISGEVPGTERPIILFGGLNGSGKTSILTAVRLALYGRQSFGKPLHNNEYTEALADLIHKGNSTTSSDSAYIELEFTYNQSGEENVYKVIRSWKKGKLDKLKLEQNGQIRSELTYDQCQGFLNELIPNGIADLFFFDGEKIAELAEDESGYVLKTAVRRLLGLDVIGKLKSDLNIYLKKQGADLLEQSVKQQLDKLDEERIAHESKAEKLREQANQKNIEITHLSKEIQNLENDLSRNGGAWAETREQESQQIDLLLKEKVELEKQIRMEMETSLPFALAPNAMKSLLNTIRAEQTLKQKQGFANELDSFLDTLKQDLSFRLSSSAPVAMEAINECFGEYIKDSSTAELLLDISERQANAIDYQINQNSQQSWIRFDNARKRLAEVENLLDHVSENVARAPEKEQLQKIFSEIRTKDKQKQALIDDYYAILEEAKLELRAALETARQIQKLHDAHRENANKNASIENAQNSILLLDKFAEQLTHSRVKTLENHFIESYKKLARKEDLQLSAVIHPKTFDVELIDEYGNKINRKAMSAGEKQIYAISILEALGKTSGRKLPIIIDTPLGRLDSHHRDKLVEFYFPTASHQVVILSTDTEIDKDYINLIQDDIAKTYEICFDGKSKSSTIKQGYFWQSATQEAV
ncbi:DNA sulfur modification protein DndD [Vibrio spartinae]|uniref:Chromosome segregation protein n=1 Tax=Vibrio spartinae TaxID=1918945 RepID=A0ABX6QX50_9VIBR|nr:DNA sulfur modification protein DndD [Vibrio spartinae]QMV13595.1 chromosome segregation protein [Vibrio spartinae]